tara:strand:+ start:11265 stop:11714 length:450 start_codon:yes stop_codon:yes gene_type:complete
MSREISAGFIIRGQDGRYLLGRAEKHPPPHSWTMFKGGQEAGEELIDTAIRELQEETGIDINADDRLNMNISTNYVFCYKLRHKDVYLFFLNDVEGALSDTEFSCSSFWGEDNLPEIGDWRWCTIEEMEADIFPSQRGVVSFIKERYEN